MCTICTEYTGGKWCTWLVYIFVYLVAYLSMYTFGAYLCVHITMSIPKRSVYLNPYVYMTVYNQYALSIHFQFDVLSIL